MYTEICAEAGTLRAIANSTPHIQFNFILVSPVCLVLGCRILLVSCLNFPQNPEPSGSQKDSLRIVAGSARRPALFPQLFPIPHPGRHLGRQPESELMREHTYLPPMVGFVGRHVAQHFHANRPRPSPAVSQKLLDPAPTTAERFSEHLRAPSGALGQSRAGLLRRAVRAVELS